MNAPAAETELDPSPGEPVAPRPGVIRRLYNWVLHWAETPYGTPALAAISFAESSFFPIPPDVLQIALSASRPRRSFFYAAVSAVASVAGAVLGWLIGYGAWEALDDFFYRYVPGVTPEIVAHVGELYRDNAFWTIFTAAFTPIPFKVITIAAGVFHGYVPLATLVLAAAIGRSGRFFLVGACMWWFGPSVRRILEKHLEWITLALGAAVVAGFAAIKLLAH
ncbi:MAG: DedA family protein [Pirellulales bacterium]|nr:DedA family protein [Pirellulales bacterium]